MPRGWLRFCRIARNSGTARFVLEQEINAYAGTAGEPVARLPGDPKDGLAAALARLGRAFLAPNA